MMHIIHMNTRLVRLSTDILYLVVPAARQYLSRFSCIRMNTFSCNSTVLIETYDKDNWVIKCIHRYFIRITNWQIHSVGTRVSAQYIKHSFRTIRCHFVLNVYKKIKLFIRSKKPPMKIWPQKKTSPITKQRRKHGKLISQSIIRTGRLLEDQHSKHVNQLLLQKRRYRNNIKISWK
jgi:hypothetical protein